MSNARGTSCFYRPVQPTSSPTAVAGSIQRGGSAREQAELAAALLASEKDRVEQRIVVDDLIAHAYECCVTRELTPDERQQFGLPQR